LIIEKIAYCLGPLDLLSFSQINKKNYNLLNKCHPIWTCDKCESKINFLKNIGCYFCDAGIQFNEFSESQLDYYFNLIVPNYKEYDYMFSTLLKYQRYSIEFYEKHHVLYMEKNPRNHDITTSVFYNKKIDFPNEFFEKYSESISWGDVSEHFIEQWVPESRIEFFSDKLDIEFISQKRLLSDSFISKFPVANTIGQRLIRIKDPHYMKKNTYSESDWGRKEYKKCKLQSGLAQYFEKFKVT
jgi:hypothetical protein